MAAVGSKPRMRCPRRAPHGQTRGDLYSCSAACHLLLCGLLPLPIPSPRLAALGSKPRVCAVPAGRLTAKPAATCTLVLRLVTFCSAACYHFQSEPMLGGLRVKTSHALSPPGASRPNPRRPVLLFCGLSPSALRLVTTLPIRARASLAALGSKPRVRCPRRAPHGQTRGDLYSCSAACHLLLAACYHFQSEPMLGGLRVKTSHALSPPGASRPNPRRPVLLFCGLSPSARGLLPLPIRAHAWRP